MGGGVLRVATFFFGSFPLALETVTERLQLTIALEKGGTLENQQ